MDRHIRCSWARTPLSIAYHDAEWGVPVHDDRILFEFLTLEGAQAGLSWETILKKREAYRAAFLGFDPARVARFTPARIERLLRNPGIVRNRLKIDSAVRNARAFLTVQQAFGSFDTYVWGFVAGVPRLNQWRTLREVPARTPESDALSRDLLGRGFKFVGSTICLRLHAGGRHGERSHDRLLPVSTCGPACTSRCLTGVCSRRRLGRQCAAAAETHVVRPRNHKRNLTPKTPSANLLPCRRSLRSCSTSSSPCPTKTGRKLVAELLRRTALTPYDLPRDDELVASADRFFVELDPQEQSQ